MFAAEFKVLHVQNFKKLKEKLENVDDYETEAKEVSDAVAEVLIRSALKVAPSGRGIGLIIAAGMLAVGGLIKLESFAGGPISGTIGRAVERVQLHNTESGFTPKDVSYAKKCEGCGKVFGILPEKVICRACKAVLCESCCSSSIDIPVNRTSYTVHVCEICFKLLQSKTEEIQQTKTEESKL